MSDGPEHITMWPVAKKSNVWQFHIECYEDVLQGMMEFYKVFIVEKQKTKVQN